MKNSRNYKKWESQARQFFGDDFWNDILSVIPSQSPNAEQSNASPPESRQPAIAVYKTERQMIIHVELPGLTNLNAIDVYTKQSHVVISGRLNQPYTGEQTALDERFTGDFKRTVPLPAEYDDEQISARYKNGLLEITLPRRRRHREEKPRRIPIQPDT